MAKFYLLIKIYKSIHAYACYHALKILPNKQTFSKTADSDTVSTYQVSSVQLVTDKKLVLEYFSLHEVKSKPLFGKIVVVGSNLSVMHLVMAVAYYTAMRRGLQRWKIDARMVASCL